MDDPDVIIPDSESASLPIVIHHRGAAHSFVLGPADTLYDLSQLLAGPALSVPVANQKFIIQPGPGFVRPPTAQTHDGDPQHLPLAQLRNNPEGRGVGPGGRQRKVTLLGATARQVAELSAEIAAATGPHPDAGNREAFLAARGRARAA